MPNKFHDDAHFQQLSLSVCENVFEQQVSKFPFEMTQPAAAAACWSWAATHSHPITPKTARGRCEGDGCVALVRPAGWLTSTPFHALSCTPKTRTHKNTRNCFFSARGADNATLAVRTQYLIVYKKLSHFEIKRCVRAAPEPLSKFRKCVPQRCVFLCSLFHEHKQTRRMVRNLLIKQFRCRIMATILGRDDFQQIWSSSIHFGK